MLRTARLLLTPVSPADLEDIHRIYSDPGTWLHLPAGRHRDLVQTADHIERTERSWIDGGLGQWTIRLREDTADRALRAGTIIGSGGCALTVGGAWNLGYRLDPASWGRGFATEVARAAVRAAREAGPARAITARVLENNPASIRVLENLGLEAVWIGASPERHPTDPLDTRHLRRRIYADRPLSPRLIEQLVELG